MKGNRTALIGLAVGLVGAILLGLFVATTSRSRAPEEGTVTAFRTIEAMPAGTTADQVAARVEQVEVPESLAPENRLTDLASVAGQRLVRPLGAGELLTRLQFSPPGPAAGGAIVPDGYEAISVEADPAPGVEGYIRVGSKVNVYGILAEETLSPTGGIIAEPYTQLVMGHVPVLAVTRGTLTGESQPPSAESAGGRIVLLLQVRPQDVPVLVFAQSQGSLWFTLANPEDPAPVAVRVKVDALDPAARTAAIAEAVAALKAEEAAAAAAAAQAEAEAQQQATPTPTEGSGQ